MTVDDLSQLEPISEPMDEDKFWTIVNKSLQETGNEDDQLKWLISETGKMTAEEMIGFRLQCERLIWELYTSEMWCAGYLMNGGCSDDGFEYFRRWIVSRGKDVYYNAKADPDSLISQVTGDSEIDFGFEFESFSYASIDAFKEKFKKNIWDYTDYETFRTKRGYTFEITFNWKEDEPETMKAICPKLYERCW